MEDKTVADINEDGIASCFYPSLDRLRIILMFLMCINLFGFPTAFGGMVRTLCGFVPIAFYIISGYLVLQDNEHLPPLLLSSSFFTDRPVIRQNDTRSKRIARAVRRSAVAFAVLAVAFFLINFFYFRSSGVNILPAFKDARLWFNFLALNYWPFDIGSIIWYVQSMLYAYVIIWFLDKWKLLRFDWLISLLLIIVAVLSGELAGVLPINIFGYTYFHGNFINRALPYILLGGFIRRKMDKLGGVARIWYVVGIVIGSIMTVAETVILAHFGVPGYYGHLIGMAVVAFSVCMLAFQDCAPIPGFEAVFGIPRGCLDMIYYIAQPVSIGLTMLLAKLDTEIVAAAIGFVGITVFIVCFLAVWLISLAVRFLNRNKVPPDIAVGD